MHKNTKNPVLISIAHIDDLGRVVIPKDIFKTMQLSERDILNFTMYKDAIEIEKHIPGVSRHKKPIGLMRTLDRLHRVVLPAELRDELGIKIRDKIQFILTADNVLIAEKLKEAAA